MHIDWFVFFAQLLNFFILVYLLRRFLYGRIIKAMDQREANIAQRYEDAERLRAEAQKASEECDKQLQELRAKAEEMLNQAKEAADARRNELMGKARDEIAQMQQRWIETINRARVSFLEDLRRRAGAQIYAIVRNVLSDLADEGLEQRMLQVFIRQLQNIDEKTQEELKESFANAKTGVTIQSSFNITETDRQKIQEAIKPYVKNGFSIQYDVQPEIISGIEMRAHGHKIAWSLNDYLVTLEESFSYALQEESLGKQ